MEPGLHNSLDDDHRHLRNHRNLLELQGKLEACSHLSDTTYGWYLTPLGNHYKGKDYQIVAEILSHLTIPQYNNNEIKFYGTLT